MDEGGCAKEFLKHLLAKILSRACVSRQPTFWLVVKMSGLIIEES